MDGKLDEMIGPPSLMMETGQTTSYAAGDDGDLRKGVAWPDPRFTDHGDGTVTDNLTGLMWTKDANLAKLHWDQALSYSAALTTGGFTDWRLPNIRELQSLIDYRRFHPALPVNHPFSNVQIYDFYWSSTTNAYNTDYAWAEFLGSGFEEVSDKDSSNYCVWCVRGGS